MNGYFGNNGPSSSTLTKTSDSYSVFTFLCPKDKSLTHREQQQYVRQILNQNGSFDDGVVLDTMENGVLFPMVHYISHPVSVKHRIAQGLTPKDDGFGDYFTLHQGLYKEVKSITPEEQPMSPLPPDGGQRAYILIGYKSLERSFDSLLERTWKEWTGARFVYLNLKDEFGLRRIGFYHRAGPDDMDLFMYIVLVEATGLTPSNHLRFLDFVQRMRVDRMKGYISAYRALPLGGENPHPTAPPAPPRRGIQNGQREVIMVNGTVGGRDGLQTPSLSISAMLREIAEPPVKVETW